MPEVGKSIPAIPLLLITIGVGWLLTVRGVLPQVNWVWVLALAMAGLLTIAVGERDRFTLVLGPFLILTSIASVLRQTGYLTFDSEVPILTIVLGLLMLVVRMLPLREPSWTKRSV